jgi:hypothetical protein
MHRRNETSSILVASAYFVVTTDGAKAEALFETSEESVGPDQRSDVKWAEYKLMDTSAISKVQNKSVPLHVMQATRGR